MERAVKVTAQIRPLKTNPDHDHPPNKRHLKDSM